VMALILFFARLSVKERMGLFIELGYRNYQKQYDAGIDKRKLRERVTNHLADKRKFSPKALYDGVIPSECREIIKPATFNLWMRKNKVSVLASALIFLWAFDDPLGQAKALLRAHRRREGKDDGTLYGI